MVPRLVVEGPLRSSTEPTHWTSRFGWGRTVLFRMVAGQAMIGLLLLMAVLVSVWQLNAYNDARRVWMETQERLSLISEARQGGKELVLITHRVVFTQAPFLSGSEMPERPTDSIADSAGSLNSSRVQLEQEAASLPVDTPTRARLVHAVGLIDKLIGMADRTIELGLAGDWRAAQKLISETSQTSLVPKFDRVHIDLKEELGRATVLTQEDAVNAQEQMDRAGRTAIGVTVSVAVIVIGLGFLLSLTTIRSITGPIDELSHAASQLADGAFDVRVPATRQDEFGHLARVFNDMAARLGEIYAGMDQEIKELRIVVHEAKWKEKSEEIIKADYFKWLRAKAAELREMVSSKP